MYGVLKNPHQYPLQLTASPFFISPLNDTLMFNCLRPRFRPCHAWFAGAAFPDCCHLHSCSYIKVSRSTSRSPTTASVSPTDHWRPSGSVCSQKTVKRCRILHLRRVLGSRTPSPLPNSTASLASFRRHRGSRTEAAFRGRRSVTTMAEALSYSRPPMVERLADRLEKPLIDDRTYRVIKLPNELEALLIHDPQTDKASASMDVNVGSFSDPQEMPGTAHAVEHLLFMGTQKVSTGTVDEGCWSLLMR